VLTDHDYEVSTSAEGLLGLLAVADELKRQDIDSLYSLRNLSEESFEKQVPWILLAPDCRIIELHPLLIMRRNTKIIWGAF
jgi:hypothetical protein